MSRYRFEEVSLSALKPNPKNARTHSKKQIRQIAKSIRHLGFNAPIIADDCGNQLTGHARTAAAKLEKITHVPVLFISGLTETQKRAFALADNKLPEGAGWDQNILAVELNSLSPLLSEIGLDISLTGFAAPEIDQLFSDLLDSERDPADEPAGLSQTPISQVGDMWELGRHRLLCGDSQKEAAYERLMAGSEASMVFADPPYNVSIKSVQGRGRRKHLNS